METIKILEKQGNLTWDYDEEADVIYISVGKPRKAVGLDIGKGTIVRYIEETGEIAGFTILGVKERILTNLTQE